MMLSFNIAKRSSKATTKRAFNRIAGNNNEEEHRSTSTRVYITEFDPTKTLTSSTRTPIIPPLQNRSLPSKRTKDLELPIQPNSFTNLPQFESRSITLDDETKSGEISYGLAIRKQQPDSNGNNDSANTQIDEREGTLKGRPLNESIGFGDKSRRSGHDPRYEVMSVAEFGEAYLRGCGWSEESGVGRKRKVVGIYMSEARTFCGKGTGFKPNGIAKPEEPEPKSSELKKHAGERRIVRGKEVRGSRNGSTEDDKGISNGCAKNKGHDGKPGWLISHIRVRVISKDLKDGRLYLNKGEVVDVVGTTSCDLLMDESGELIQGVDQELVETALPKPGGPLYVLSGRHKGVYGTLVERDLDQEIGMVQDANTLALFKVKLEQIAEYIGEPSLVGY